MRHSIATFFIVCTLAQAIRTIRPGAEWNLRGDTYAGLEWLDTVQTKPSQAEITTALSTCATTSDGSLLSDVRSGAVAESLTGGGSLGMLERGAALVIMDELNVLRQRDVDRSADVAAATSLADLKTRWAARSAFPQRTATQIKTAIQNKINAGDAD